VSFVINTINIFLTELGLSEEISKLLSPLIMLAACFALLYLVLYLLLKAKKIKRSTFDFYLFISPWLIGFLVLVLWPILYSFQLSFTKWDIVNDPEFIGLANYREAFLKIHRFTNPYWLLLNILLSRFRSNDSCIWNRNAYESKN